MFQETPESLLEISEDSNINSILSNPTILIRKYPSHLQTKPKKITLEISSERPFVSLTQISSNSENSSLINPNMVQIFYW